MTKTPVDHNKGKKNVKLLSEVNTEEEAVAVGNQNENTQIIDEEDSASSVLSDGEEHEDSEASSIDSDQALANELNVVLKQATEAKVVIPPVLPQESKAVTGSAPSDQNDKASGSKDLTDVHESDGSLSPVLNQDKKTIKRKEVERRKDKKARKLSKEKRDKIKAQMAKQVIALTTAEQTTQHLTGPQAPLPLIPKLSAPRVRQQQAVLQARNRMGLSSKYGNLSNLLDLHRLLMKGNPFALIDPKQVYPYFNLVPGVHMAAIQPLFRAWQEKATRILYQLLLIETRGDIARIKKRTWLFKTEPVTFCDAFTLKLDIGLENEHPLEATAVESPSGSGTASCKDQSTSSQASVDGTDQPQIKKSKKNINGVGTKSLGSG